MKKAEEPILGLRLFRASGLLPNPRPVELGRDLGQLLEAAYFLGYRCDFRQCILQHAVARLRAVLGKSYGQRGAVGSPW